MMNKTERDKARAKKYYEMLIEQIGAEAVAEGLAQYFNADEVCGGLNYIARMNGVDLNTTSYD